GHASGALPVGIRGETSHVAGSIGNEHSSAVREGGNAQGADIAGAREIDRERGQYDAGVAALLRERQARAHPALQPLQRGTEPGWADDRPRWGSVSRTGQPASQRVKNHRLLLNRDKRVPDTAPGECNPTVKRANISFTRLGAAFWRRTRKSSCGRNGLSD